MKVRLTKPQTGTAGPLPAGTEIEHADAYRLIELGVAEPLDEEAKAKMQEIAARAEANQERAARARAEIAAAQKADRLARASRVPENRKLKTK